MRKFSLIVLLGFFCWTALAAAGRAFSGEEGRTDEPVIGVKIYAHEGSVPELFAEWRALGINTVFVSPALASQSPFRELARKQGISLFLILPIFYDPEALEKDPGLYAITADLWNQDVDPGPGS
jgi:hypothetical protein